jgi:hypothetical protein
MIMTCDGCLQNKTEILKTPAFSFSIEQGKLYVEEHYVNLCASCLVGLHVDN